MLPLLAVCKDAMENKDCCLGLSPGYYSSTRWSAVSPLHNYHSPSLTWLLDAVSIHPQALCITFSLRACFSRNSERRPHGDHENSPPATHLKIKVDKWHAINKSDPRIKSWDSRSALPNLAHFHPLGIAATWNSLCFDFWWLSVKLDTNFFVSVIW